MKHMNKVKRIAALVLAGLLSCIAFACTPPAGGNSSNGGGSIGGDSSESSIGGGNGDNGLEDPNDKDDIIDDWGMYLDHRLLILWLPSWQMLRWEHKWQQQRYNGYFFCP